MGDHLIWIDRGLARTFRLEGAADSAAPLVRVEREREAEALYRRLAAVAASADRVLLTGPGVAKFLFRAFLAEHHPLVLRRLVGCEAVGNLSDPDLIEYARSVLGRAVLGA